MCSTALPVAVKASPWPLKELSFEKSSSIQRLSLRANRLREDFSFSGRVRMLTRLSSIAMRFLCTLRCISAVSASTLEPCITGKRRFLAVRIRKSAGNGH